VQPAALCQGRADVKVTNTGESSQLETVSGDVLGNAAMRRHSFHKGIPLRDPSAAARGTADVAVAGWVAGHLSSGPA
jgi:hypothetical protein